MAAVTVTKENFDDLVKDNDIVVLDFWASWCGPCRSFAPIFEASSVKHPDIVHGKVNTEEQRELAAAFQIRSIPSTVFFREQIPIHLQPGMLPPDALEDLITQVKGLDMDNVRDEIAKREEG